MEEDRYQDVCTYVRRLIEQGQLRPGDRLPTERALSQDLGVSRGTVRDGLRLLESMGVLESRQGSGNYLSNHMGQYLAQSLHFMLLLGEIDYQSINRMRRAIELQSYRIAIQTSTPEQVQGLLDSWPSLQAVLLPVSVITVVTTIFVMAVSGLVTQTVIRRERKPK